MKRNRQGFTLVELLVVIGIIALLISILLPSLNRAREAARTIKCASNLRNIAAGLEIYKAENKGFFPAAYLYKGKGQLANPPVSNEGYVHWSSYLYGTKSKNDNDTSMYRRTDGWQMFICPSMPNGGLPPTNTFPENVANGVTVDVPDVIDMQAPRMSYTVNEAIMPRNKFAGGPSQPRVCRFVRSSEIRSSANVVLATEFNPNEKLAVDTSSSGGGQMVMKSHRPVHAFIPTSPGGDDSYAVDKAGTGNLGGVPGYRRNYELSPGRCENYDALGGDLKDRLKWVGRNHGAAQVGGPGNQDLRRTNFLYVDGHVETKKLGETLYPMWQWGETFYSLSPNNDAKRNDNPTPEQLAPILIRPVLQTIRRSCRSADPNATNRERQCAFELTRLSPWPWPPRASRLS